MEIQANKPTELDIKISLVSGFVGVITSPKLTFERLTKSPRTWVPSLIIVLLSILITIPFISKYQEFNLLIAKQALGSQGGGTEQIGQFGTITILIGIIVSAFFMPILLAVLIKFLNLIMGEPTKFKKIWTVTIYASLPSLLKVLLGNILMLTADADHLISTVTAGTSLAALVPQESISRFVFSMLTTLNVFTIWSLALTVIGISHVFRTKQSTVASVFVGVWLVFSLVSAYYSQVLGS